MQSLRRTPGGRGGVEDRCGTSPYRSRSCCTRAEGGRWRGDRDIGSSRDRSRSRSYDRGNSREGGGQGGSRLGHCCSPTPPSRCRSCSLYNRGCGCRDRSSHGGGGQGGSGRWWRGRSLWHKSLPILQLLYPRGRGPTGGDRDIGSSRDRSCSRVYNRGSSRGGGGQGGSRLGRGRSPMPPSRSKSCSLYNCDCGRRDHSSHGGGGQGGSGLRRGCSPTPPSRRGSCSPCSRSPHSRICDRRSQVSYYYCILFFNPSLVLCICVFLLSLFFGHTNIISRP